MRILFMGTPDFAVASLRRLVADGHEVCGVFTQPDKPKNRGHKLVPTPVKEFALTENIPVYQPLKMRDGTALELVQSLAPELTVVAAYGRILPEDILEAPRYGSINVHSSLLPKYRGAAPINWAILNGEETTGVSIMYMAKELDAGDVILQKETPIGPDEDAQALTVRLADLGAEALSEAVAAIGNGTAARTPQDESRQTYASMLTKEMSPIDWTRSAREIDCQVRGLIPWPCAACELAGQRFKVYRTAPGEQTGAAPGTVLSAGKQGIQVACGEGREPVSHGAPGGGRQAHGCGVLSAGPPVGGLSSASFTIREVFMPYYGHIYYGYGDFLANNLYVLLLIPVLLLSLWAQFQVSGSFRRYNAVNNRRRITGAQAAEAVLRAHGVFGVPVRPCRGNLTDHYDPRDNTIYLSETVYDAPTIAAVGVAAHEAGHAVQYAENYGPVRLRTAIIPATRIGSSLSFILLLVGLVLYNQSLFFIGIVLFSFTTLFQLVTLPVEFNASARAIATIDGAGLLDEDELPGAKKVLRAAALTYVAALLMSLLQLMRFVLIFIGRGGRDQGGSQ